MSADKMEGIPAEYIIPVIVTGIKYRRVRTDEGISAAVRAAVEAEEMENTYSGAPLASMKASPMMPECIIPDSERDVWPYWGYGWHGTDGEDWRSGRTDKGRASIPDIAEESWPIRPYGDTAETINVEIAVRKAICSMDSARPASGYENAVGSALEARQLGGMK